MTSASGRGTGIARALAPLAAASCLAAILLRFPPEQYRFYPQCPVYALFHIQCPGCGTTRALAALLHGNISQALHANALTTLMLPFAGVYAATCYWRYLRHQPLRLPQLPAKTTYAGIAIALGFTILRNL